MYLCLALTQIEQDKFKNSCSLALLSTYLLKTIYFESLSIKNMTIFICFNSKIAVVKYEISVIYPIHTKFPVKTTIKIMKTTLPNASQTKNTYKHKDKTSQIVTFILMHI